MELEKLCWWWYLRNLLYNYEEKEENMLLSKYISRMFEHMKSQEL